MLNLATIVLWLILIFAAIHLFVSISIIDQNRDYGGIFRPETGLAAFNIIISLLGIIAAALALFLKPTSQQQFSKSSLRRVARIESPIVTKHMRCPSVLTKTTFVLS